MLMRLRLGVQGVGRQPWVVLTLLAGLVGLESGCGQEDHGIPLYPARGQVLIGGKPEAGVQIRLHPVGKLDDMDAPRPFAGTTADGSFELGTFTDGDGAPTGKYLVTIYWPGEANGPNPPGDRLEGGYTNIKKPPFEISIAEGENQLEPFRLDPAGGPKPTVPPTPKGARRYHSSR